MGEVAVTLPDDARAELEAALRRLHSGRGLLVRASEMLAAVMGSAAAFGLRRLRPPERLRRHARELGETALRRSFDIAVLGLRPAGRFARVERFASRATAAASGVAGGFAGMLGVLPDITMTTLVIMRRIAAIAVEEGEDLAEPGTRAACLEVFAFGGSREPGEAEEAEFGYWSARLLLQGRPLVMLMSEAAASYGLRISQKFALQAIPLVGAAGGLAVNSAFLSHYENLARAHFVIRRLERTHGAALVRAAADAIQPPASVSSADVSASGPAA